MTADQTCLLLPQIYFVNQSLRKGGEPSRKDMLGAARAEAAREPRPLLNPEVLSDCLRAAPALIWVPKSQPVLRLLSQEG